MFHKSHNIYLRIKYNSYCGIKTYCDFIEIKKKP